MRQVYWLCLFALAGSGCSLVVDAGEAPSTSPTGGEPSGPQDMGEEAGRPVEDGGAGDAERAPDVGPADAVVDMATEMDQGPIDATASGDARADMADLGAGGTDVDAAPPVDGGPPLDEGLDAVADAQAPEADGGMEPVVVDIVPEGEPLGVLACEHLFGCNPELGNDPESIARCIAGIARSPRSVQECVFSQPCDAGLEQFVDCGVNTQNVVCVGAVRALPPCNNCPYGTFVPEGTTCIPAGTFMMGTPADEAGRRAGDPAPYEVTITRPFLMETVPVTQDVWGERVNLNPSANEGRNGLCEICPVENVTWFDAAGYANLKSTVDALDPCYTLTNCQNPLGGGMVCDPDIGFDGPNCEGYRLPTEAEYEYAARAGTTTPFWGGTEVESLQRVAWYRPNSAVDEVLQTRPVGHLHPNPWGLYDIQGNVSEWVYDGLGDYPAEPSVDPIGDDGTARRVHRGGSYRSNAGSLRSSHRGTGRPAGDAIGDIGFRLVRTLGFDDPVIECDGYIGCLSACDAPAERDCTAACGERFPHGKGLYEGFMNCAVEAGCLGENGADEDCARAQCRQETAACFDQCPAALRCEARQVQACSFGRFREVATCRRSERCVDGLCEAVPEIYGTECLGLAEAGDCLNAGLICSEGRGADALNENPVCRHPDTAMGVGPQRAGAECYGLADCLPGLVCTAAGRCDEGTDGTPCVDDLDCSGVCLDNACATP